MPSCRRRHGKSRPHIHVSLGSFLSVSFAQLDEIAGGLAKSKARACRRGVEDWAWSQGGRPGPTTASWTERRSPRRWTGSCVATRWGPRTDLRKAALLKDAARAACEEVGERCHVFRQVHFGVGSAIKSRPVELNVEVVDYYLSQCDR